MKTKVDTPELNKSLSSMAKRLKSNLISDILAKQVQKVTGSNKRKSRDLVSKAPTPKKSRLGNQKHSSTPLKANVTIKQERDSDEVGQGEETNVLKRSTARNSSGSKNKDPKSESPILNNSSSNKLNVKIEPESSCEGEILPKSKLGVKARNPLKPEVSSSSGNAVHSSKSNQQTLAKNKGNILTKSNGELTDSSEDWSSVGQENRPFRLEYEDKLVSKEFLSTATSSSTEDEMSQGDISQLCNVQKQPPEKPARSISKTVAAKSSEVSKMQRNINISNEFERESRAKKRNSEDSSKTSQNIRKSINDNIMESEMSATWKEKSQYNAAQVSREDLQSESSSDIEMPVPKKIKLEDFSEGSAIELDNTSKVMESQMSALSWKEAAHYNAMSWTEKLKHKFPGIEKVTISNQLPFTEARYSLLLVPKSIDPRSLLNLKCHLNKSTVVNLNNTEYVFEPIQKKPDPLLVSMNGPRLINLESVISLQQSLPNLSLKEMDITKRTDIPLPNALKERHPLFGVTYKEKLSLGKKVKKKLQEAVEHKKKIEEKERRRKKRKKKDNSKGVEESVLNIFNSIDSSSDDLMRLLPVKTEDDLDTSKSPHKTRKNRSHEHLSISENESFGSAKKKHKSKRKERTESVNMTGDTSKNSFSDDSPKKEKRKRSENADESEEKHLKKKHK